MKVDIVHGSVEVESVQFAMIGDKAGMVYIETKQKYPYTLINSGYDYDEDGTEKASMNFALSNDQDDIDDVTLVTLTPENDLEKNLIEGRFARSNTRYGPEYLFIDNDQAEYKDIYRG